MEVDLSREEIQMVCTSIASMEIRNERTWEREWIRKWEDLRMKLEGRIEGEGEG